MSSDPYILLVEDNRDDELLTLRALEKGGIANEVRVVRDGVEAWDFLFARGAYRTRGLSDLPQVVLLDLKLPKLDGHDLLRRLRAEERTRLLPVVVLTSSNEEKDILESYNLGANSYVQKPVDIQEFAAAIRSLGLYWLVLNKLPQLGRKER